MSRPVCAIVGAGEGLGRALAAKFANQGFDIALISRSEAGSAAAIEAATAVAANARYFSADATQPETIESTLAKAADEMGEIDVLIYNARGEFVACEPLDMSYAALEDVLPGGSYRCVCCGQIGSAGHDQSGLAAACFFQAPQPLIVDRAHTRSRQSANLVCGGYCRASPKPTPKTGVHIVHFRLDCDLDVPYMRDSYGDRYDPEESWPVRPMWPKVIG